jgi:predicted RNA-binding Zn ribbon-like protein
LGSSVAKRFRSGRPCLDFVHTAATASGAEPELVVDKGTLERWLAHVLGSDVVRAEPDDVAAAHQLREALERLVRARGQGRPLTPGDVQILNVFAAAPPPVFQLTVDGAFAPSVISAAAGLSFLARDAIDLLAGPLGHRIRVCAADGCEFLFVDASRPGTRRWCSMQRCGNLSKLRAYREAHHNPGAPSLEAGAGQ